MLQSTTTEDGGQPQFFAGLQSLRGLAALIVVVFHIPAWYVPFSEADPVRNGYLMVHLFFVLSGFVLMHAYGRTITTPRDLGTFVVLRLGRLYPVHLVFLLLFLGIEISRYVAATRFGIVGPNNRAAFQENGTFAFVQQLFLAQALGFTPDATTFNAPSWSISTEFYTYLIFGAAILVFSPKVFRRFALVIAVGATAILSVWHGIGDHRFLIESLAGFFLGTLSYGVYRSMRAWHPFVDWPLLLLVSIGALMCAKAPNSVLDVLMFPLSALLILSIVLTPASRIGGILDSRPLRFLGDISYSLYMCHALVLWLANQVCRALLRPPEAMVDGMLTPQLQPVQALVAYPLVVLITIAAAWATYRLVENPCRRWSRQLGFNALRPKFVRAAGGAGGH